MISFQNKLIPILLMALLVFLGCQTLFPTSQSSVDPVSIHTDAQGQKLQIAGKDFMVFGMNWDYCPPGTNYTYSFWSQPDSFITTALEYEMSFLQEMGVNTIRQYVGIPPKWVKYIFEEFGIHTILNHPLARYGYEKNGVWIPVPDYGEPAFRSMILDEVKEMVETFQNTPGILIWMLGNENNYGLFWNSAETKDMPADQSLHAAQARQLYSLVNEVVELIHSLDPAHPVALANGDIQYIELIAETVENLDIFGANVYRGESFGDIFKTVQDQLGIPILFTEFGADAFNAIVAQENQRLQAKYLLSNWEEIYLHSYGKGLIGNSLGGCTFQFSDGWWKYDQTKNLSVHDTHASWSNGGYSEDFIPGKNNMNEEWFGICAKGPVDSLGFYTLYPRLAYQVLDRVHSLNPLDPGVDSSQVIQHFEQTRNMFK